MPKKANGLNAFDKIDDTKFQSCLRFIESNEVLPHPAMDLLVLVCSGPIEQAMYDAVIGSCPEGAPHKDFVSAGAYLYYLQSRLNRKIGRTYYNSYGERDKTLLIFILDEIKRRRADSFPHHVIGEETPQRDNYSLEIYEYFLRSYPALNYDKIVDLKAVNSAIKYRYTGTESISTTELLEFLDGFVQKAVDNAEGGADDGKDYHAYMADFYGKNGGKLITSESDLKRQLSISREDSFRKRPPTKNEMYYFSIACCLNIYQFDTLRRKLRKAKNADPSQYAVSHENDRDSTIIGVIRDIERWKKETAKKVNNVEQAIPGQIIKDVNEMLRENGYIDLYGKRPKKSPLA